MEMKGEIRKHRSNLLELSAADDVTGFVYEVEEKGFDVGETGFWYGRRLGSKKMGYEERTPLTIASMYGSNKVLNYIIGTGKVDVNRACDSDGATALHCAAAGGSNSSVETVKILLDASADVDSVDVNGNKPGDLIAPFLKSDSSKRKLLGMLLRRMSGGGDFGEEVEVMQNKAGEKKEYPIDISLPDINNGMYGTDEFRMYSFKVKPCSRAYSHDWTECPFVHPGENARRRDPKKFSYSCVPCPEFRKGSCVKGDSCEYAHGVFESWLHPAQYRTRLCKDETGCARKVCFFAHKRDELRPLYASTGSAMPSPNSNSVGSMDMATMSPLTLGASTPPMSPSVATSSPMWQTKVNHTPPTLQLPGSRLKAALSARDFELEMELLGLESILTQQQQQQRQQLVDDLSSLSSPSRWNNNDYNRFGKMNPTNLDSVFGSLDSSTLSQLQSSPRITSTTTTHTQLQSPTGLQMRQNMNQLRGSYPSNHSSSPVRKPSTFGFDSSAAVAAAVMNSRSASFSKRSHSFVDRGAPTGQRPTNLMSSNLSDWSSPDGKLDWGYNGEDLSKLKKSASFGFRNGNGATQKMGMVTPSNVDEPDVSWVNSLVKDVPSVGAGLYSSEKKYGGVNDTLPLWAEQMYMEQEQMVA